jgi:hypothetical protein
LIQLNRILLRRNLPARSYFARELRRKAQMNCSTYRSGANTLIDRGQELWRASHIASKRFSTAQPPSQGR